MKIKLLAFLVFCFSQTFAQNISFSDLISFMNKSNWESVNQTLMNKGWDFYGSSEDGKIEWSFGKDIFDKAKGWITLNTSLGSPQRISFQFHTKIIYNSMQKSIIASGLYKLSSNIVEDGLVLLYINKNYTVSLTTAKNEDEYSANAIYKVVVSKTNFVSYENKKTKVKNGLIKEYDDDGSLICECTYKNGVLNGPYKEIKDDQLVERGSYILGKKNGKFKSYVNGKIDIEGTYKNDAYEGMLTYYFYDEESGKLSSRSFGSFSNNSKQGVWKDVIYINGKEFVYEFVTYKNDILNGPFKRIYDNEIIIGNYNEGEFDGQYKLYVDYLTKEGDPLYGNLAKAYLKEEGLYKNGVQNGKWRYYDESKKLIEEVTFVDGIRQ